MNPMQMGGMDPIQMNTTQTKFEEDYKWDDEKKVMIIKRKQTFEVKALGVVTMGRQLEQQIAGGENGKKIQDKMKTAIRKAKQHMDECIKEGKILKEDEPKPEPAAPKETKEEPPKEKTEAATEKPEGE